MNYTIDASVFVASARQNEPHYLESLNFLDQARAQGLSVFYPSLVLTECSAAIVRRTGDSAMALRLVSLVKNFGSLHLVNISDIRAEHAAQIAQLIAYVALIRSTLLSLRNSLRHLLPGMVKCWSVVWRL
jgi:predicted nucleic acid-binding protein